MSQMEMNQQERSGGRTVTLKETRWVSRSQAEVFAYVADFTNSQEWDPGVTAARRLDETPLGVGSKFELLVKFGASVIPMVYEITEYEPSERVVLSGRGENLDAIDEIRLGTHDNMTVIEYRADLTFHGFLRHVIPLMRRSLGKVATRALDGMVEAIEK